MAQSIQQPLVDVVARYEGRYRPHWEIAHIAVRVSRTRQMRRTAIIVLGLLATFWLGLLGPVAFCVFLGLVAVLAAVPAEERWPPHFPPNCEVGLDDPGGPIEFEGIVSAPGWYGHKGNMCRTVEIVRVLRYKQAQRSAAADRPCE